MITETIELFIKLFIKLTILFIGISFLVYFIQNSIKKEPLEKLLSTKGFTKYIFAVGLGAVTPFCSCSTIPMLKGFINAKVSFGAIMAFLFTSPLLNPLVIGLLVLTFGGKITFVYVVMSVTVAVLASILLEKTNFAKQIIETNKPAKSSCCSKNSCCSAKKEQNNENKQIKNIKKSYKSAIRDYKNVFKYLVIGISIGALTYGFVPAEFITKYAGSNNPFAIIIASFIGIPLYISISAMIPLSSALIAKGMGLGAVIALIIGSAGASLTEVILLRSLFKTKLIVAFLFVVLGMAIATGFVVDSFFA